MLLALGVGSEGVALSLAGILGWLWYSDKRRPRRAAAQEHYQEYYEESEYRDLPDYRDGIEPQAPQGGGWSTDEDLSSWD
jgi:hypothetical protein